MPCRGLSSGRSGCDSEQKRPQEQAAFDGVTGAPVGVNADACFMDWAVERPDTAGEENHLGLPQSQGQAGSLAPPHDVRRPHCLCNHVPVPMAGVHQTPLTSLHGTTHLIRLCRCQHSPPFHSQESLEVITKLRRNTVLIVVCFRAVCGKMFENR